MLRAGHHLAWQRCKFHPERAQDPIPASERQLCAHDVDLEATQELVFRVPFSVAALHRAVLETARRRLPPEGGRPLHDSEVFEALLDAVPARAEFAEVLAELALPAGPSVGGTPWVGDVLVELTAGLEVAAPGSRQGLLQLLQQRELERVVQPHPLDPAGLDVVLGEGRHLAQRSQRDQGVVALGECEDSRSLGDLEGAGNPGDVDVCLAAAAASELGGAALEQASRHDVIETRSDDAEAKLAGIALCRIGPHAPSRFPDTTRP